MSETWYMATAMGSSSSIEQVEIERHNEKSVWKWEKTWGKPALRRHNRVSDFNSYFPNFDQAKIHLTTHYTNIVKDFQKKADYYTAIMHQVDAITAESTTPDSLEGSV